MKKYVVLLFLCLLLAGCTVKSPTPSQPVPDTTPSDSEHQDRTEPGVTVPDKKPADNTPSKTPEEIALESMTTQEKIGQLLMIGFNKGTPDADLKTWIENYKIGGFILFSRNYDTFDDLYQLTQKLHQFNSQNKSPLFISVDAEGGTVYHLPREAAQPPNAQRLGEIDDPDLTRKIGEIIGRQLLAGGINMDFAPVLDIVVNPNNKLLIRRSYGNNPELVSRHGLAFIDGLQSQDVLAVGKHFPGHGDTVVDSHKNLPVISVAPDIWQKREVVPFQNAIDHGLDVLMVGHLAFPQMDSSGLPATQSPFFIQQILREEMGYGGVLITDDLEMKGFAQGQDFAEAALTSFRAGMDILLICHTPEKQLQVLEALTEQVESGQISQKRLDESVLRILKVKSRLKKLPSYTLEKAREIFEDPEYQRILEDIEKR